jgi:hypothetical protein
MEFKLPQLSFLDPFFGTKSADVKLKAETSDTSITSDTLKEYLENVRLSDIANEASEIKTSETPVIMREHSNQMIPTIDVECDLSSPPDSFISENLSNENIDFLDSSFGTSVNPASRKASFMSDASSRERPKKVLFMKTNVKEHIKSIIRPRAKSYDPNMVDYSNITTMTQTPEFSTDVSKYPKQIETSVLEHKLENLIVNENEEAKDQVSDLKLASSVYTSTLLNGSALATNMDYKSVSNFENISLGSSFNASMTNTERLPVPHALVPKVKKTAYIMNSTISAPTTPGASLLTFAYNTSLAPKKENTDKEEDTKSYVPRVALSAHEIASIPAIDLKKLTTNQFNIIRKVGKGGFAKVFLVRLKKSTGKYFALKCIKKDDIIRLKQEKQILNEKNILKKIKHPFIVDLFHSFQNKTHLFMALEFVPGGDLYGLIKHTSGFPEDVAKFYIGEALIALDYLHSINVVYRDLKPEVY